MSKSPAPPAKTAASRSGSVQSVERALSLLEVLGEDEEGYRLTDLAARTEMALASLYGGIALANAGLGAVGGYAALSQYTNLGGQLTVFALPN